MVLLRDTQRVILTNKMVGKMAKDLLDEEYFENQIKNAFNELAVNRKNILTVIFSFVMGFGVSLRIISTNSPIADASKITDIFLSTELALFACFYTVFSVVMTFIQDYNLQVLFNTLDKEYKTMLNRAVSYYESISCLYFIGIAISIVYKIILLVLPIDFIFINSSCVSKFVAFLLIGIYFTYSIRIILEIKSVIKNTSFILRVGLDCKIKFKK